MSFRGRPIPGPPLTKHLAGITQLGLDPNPNPNPHPHPDPNPNPRCALPPEAGGLAFDESGEMLACLSARQTAAG